MRTYERYARTKRELTTSALVPAPPTQRFVDAVTAAAAKDLGDPVEAGTVVVGAPDRAGSTAAGAYPLDLRTIISCAPELVERVWSLEGPVPLTGERFVDDDQRVIAYASGRPWRLDPDFDDIGVLTHPAHRGHRLGAAVGFEIVNSVAAVTFG